MTHAERAFRDFFREVGKVPWPDALGAVHEVFRELAARGFFNPAKPYLNVAELASFTKFIVLYGRSKSRVPTFDLCVPLNRYKDFWSAAECESKYEENPEHIGAFLIRFVYQQLPFLVYPERVLQMFRRSLALFADSQTAALESSLSLEHEFERHAGLPLGTFWEIALKTYYFFLRHPSGTLRDILSILEES